MHSFFFIIYISHELSEDPFIYTLFISLCILISLKMLSGSKTFWLFPFPSKKHNFQVVRWVYHVSETVIPKCYHELTIFYFSDNEPLSPPQPLLFIWSPFQRAHSNFSWIFFQMFTDCEYSKKKKYFYSVCICVYMYIYINNCKFLLVIFLWLSSWNVCVARHVCDGMYGFNLIIILCCAKLHIYVNLDDCSSWQLVSVSVHL